MKTELTKLNQYEIFEFDTYISIHGNQFDINTLKALLQEYNIGFSTSYDGLCHEAIQLNKLKAVECTCENGYSWVTDINPAAYPNEDMSICIKCEILKD